MESQTGSTVRLRCPFCLKMNAIELERAASGPRCGECARPFHLDRPVRVDESDFDATVMGAGAPVLVDFYADWCAPCKIVAPFLDELAREHEGRILVAKVDTDRNPGLAARFGIRGIPTIILFRAGEEVTRSVGYEPDRLRAMAAGTEQPA